MVFHNKFKHHMVIKIRNTLDRKLPWSWPWVSMKYLSDDGNPGMHFSPLCVRRGYHSDWL